VGDDYIQQGNLFHLAPPNEQQRLIAALVGSLSRVPVEHFTRADPNHGDGIAKASGLA
jgi:catalase